MDRKVGTLSLVAGKKNTLWCIDWDTKAQKSHCLLYFLFYHILREEVVRVLSPSSSDLHHMPSAPGAYISTSDRCLSSICWLVTHIKRSQERKDRSTFPKQGDRVSSGLTQQRKQHVKMGEPEGVKHGEM